MTAFATCAYPECFAKIPYNPETDTERPRYCNTHMQNNPRDLYIKVTPKPLLKIPPAIPKPTPENVILICPTCKIRREVSYRDFCESPDGLTMIMKQVICPNKTCNGAIMVYHKDADKYTYMGFLQEYVR
jgi:hypothetical protein